MSNLIRLVYVSEAVGPVSKADLAGLLAVAQRNNAARGLSGLLLFGGGHFMQVLEGTAEAVAERYDVIAADPRHRRVNRMLAEVTSARLFDRWTMGWLDLNAATAFDRGQVRGLIDRSVDPTVPTDRTQVHKLLTNFRDQMAAAAAAARAA